MRTKVKAHIRKKGRRRVRVRRHNRRIKPKRRRSLERLLGRNYSSFKVYEDLGKRKKEALMRKGDVTKFFRQYPEYRLQAKDVKIKLLEDREPSMEIDPETEFAPGMYIPKKDEEEIRLFPIKPEFIPEKDKERAEKFYGAKERFPAALVHELEHHSTFEKDMEKINRLPLSLEQKEKFFEDIQEDKARKAEDIWLEKSRRRQRR